MGKAHKNKRRANLQRIQQNIQHLPLTQLELEFELLHQRFIVLFLVPQDVPIHSGSIEDCFATSSDGKANYLLPMAVEHLLSHTNFDSMVYVVVEKM